MKREKNAESWLRDYQEFLSAEPIHPPKGVSESILSQVFSDLNPSPWKVFLKLTLIHTLAGAITLLFCPQFGIQLLGDIGLMSLLMRWGDEACMLGCGFVFMTGSLLSASLVLRPEEVQVIRKTRILYVGSLGLLSMGFFICAGSGVVFASGLFWLLGSLAGGSIGLEASWAFRNWMRRRSLNY